MQKKSFFAILAVGGLLCGCDGSGTDRPAGSGGSMQGAGGAGPGFDGSGKGSGKDGLAATEGSGTGADMTNSVGSGPQTPASPSKKPAPGNQSPQQVVPGENQTQTGQQQQNQ